ncbi:MAG: hypothetical protein JST43_04100 [Bacteroidetes bacterium]|nr:hypothetical protein [Bacteroidota bacterium]
MLNFHLTCREPYLALKALKFAAGTTIYSVLPFSVCFQTFAIRFTKI